MSKVFFAELAQTPATYSHLPHQPVQPSSPGVLVLIHPALPHFPAPELSVCVSPLGSPAHNAVKFTAHISPEVTHSEIRSVYSDRCIKPVVTWENLRL